MLLLYLSCLQQLLFLVMCTELLDFLPEIQSEGGQTRSGLSLPWYPSVVLIKLTIKQSYCAGALVSSTWVLTAGHCVSGELDDSMRIYAGAENFYFNNSNTQERTSNYFRVPYSFRQTSNFGTSDLALINLKEGFDRYSRVTTTPVLPLISSVSEMKCQVVGYNVSQISHLSDGLPLEMDLLEYNIMIKRECLNNAKLVTESQLKYRSWICQLDKSYIEDSIAESGVLLFCKVNNSIMTLVGVAIGKFHTIRNFTGVGIYSSWENSDPVVFTNICPYLTWMRTNIGPEIMPSPGRLGSSCYLPSLQNTVVMSFCTFYICLFITLFQLSK